MSKNQLNSLVMSYRNGNEQALDEIFRKVNPLIERASSELDHLVGDVTKFDCRVILKAKQLVEKSFDTTKGNFISVLKTTISKEKSDFLNRRTKNLDEISMEFLAEPQGDELGYQFEASDNTEDEILFNEKIALLAQGDQRKTVVLNEWSKGAADKSISELLAQRFGGKSESHRKFITRFKTDCQKRLLTTAY